MKSISALALESTQSEQVSGRNTNVKEFSIEDKQQTLEILKTYHQSPCARLRNQLVQLNIGLVKKEVGYWMRQSSEGYEDLFQVGCMGLIGAIERFDLSKGYAFSSFATRYVRGEIQHYLRDRCSILREPSEREVAEALGVSSTEWQEIKLAYRNRSPLSLDAPIGSEEDGSVYLSDLMTDLKQDALQDENISPDPTVLYSALNVLEQRTRQILEYVFLDDITQREVAKLLGISAVTVSRQVKKGLTTLRSNLVLQA
jgi:RNA polymerase sigma-B factor